MSGDLFSHTVDNEEPLMKFEPVKYINFGINIEDICTYKGNCKRFMVNSIQHGVELCYVCKFCKKVNIPKMLNNQK